jgi:hypothetical protein
MVFGGMLNKMEPYPFVKTNGNDKNKIRKTTHLSGWF